MRMWNWLLLSAAVLCFAGCSERGPERVGMSGEVTYNGDPIEDGEISFLPDVGTDAPPTSTTIVEGKYELPAKWALVPGTYKVSVNSYKVSLNDGNLPGSTLDRPPPPSGIVVKEQLLPEKFNTKSTIEKLTVKSGQAAFTQDFDLKD
ncbi:MAG: hypothetical protein JWM11_7348 [Planctomycetaceae bacterium]|nr:hypothetical protein [Planctomycetaceae bacterium]